MSRSIVTERYAVVELTTINPTLSSVPFHRLTARRPSSQHYHTNTHHSLQITEESTDSDIVFVVRVPELLMEISSLANRVYATGGGGAHLVQH